MDDDLIQLLNMAFFYLKFRPRTIKETREHLYKKVRTTHWSHEAVDKVIDHLIELKFLDDKEFINYLVTSRTRTKVKGIYAIKQELNRFGVDKELVEEYFLITKSMKKPWPKKLYATAGKYLKTFLNKNASKKPPLICEVEGLVLMLVEK